MASIVIKDLQESQELDRRAMAVVIGGARRSAGKPVFGGRGRSIELPEAPAVSVNPRLRFSRNTRM